MQCARYVLWVLWVFLSGLDTASAHAGAGIEGGFSSGFIHPILGWDHVLAMLAVGLWGAFLGNPAIYLLPVVFPLVMAFGGVFGILGNSLFGVEVGIACSSIVLGGMIAFAVRPPIWFAAVIVGVFAIFHGYAHGVELPKNVAPLLNEGGSNRVGLSAAGLSGAGFYCAGFVVATGVLHLLGIALGFLVRWPMGQVAVRTGGGVIALCGVNFLVGAV